MKRVTLIIGHPRSGSFNHGIAAAYVKAAVSQGAEVRVIDLAEISFDLSTGDLHQLHAHGPQELGHLPVEIQSMIADVTWADHLVFVHPVWWGTYPAALKGFIDRVFLSGVVFKYGKTGRTWDKFLKGRTARVLSTMDAPGLFDRYWYRSPARNSLRRSLLWYCGVTRVRTATFTPVRGSTAEQRQKWLDTVAAFAIRDVAAR